VLAAEGHLERAQIAEREGRPTSAGEAYLNAAACLHTATTVPLAAPEVHARAADALHRALTYLDSAAVHLSGSSFAGVLRHPTGEPDAPLVVIVPGMDSSKVEFFAVSEALLRRGLATLSIDGPGQGELTTTSVPTLRYDHVVGAALDAAETAGHTPPAVGLIALSLGGFYGATTLAQESRIVAGVIISGPSSLTWQLLPPPVQLILTQRYHGDEDAARRFADAIDVETIAAKITQPLLVVDGTSDVIPGVANGELLAQLATNGSHLMIDDGDHLVGNRRPEWLPLAGDFLHQHLTVDREQRH